MLHTTEGSTPTPPSPAPSMPDLPALGPRHGAGAHGGAGPAPSLSDAPVLGPRRGVWVDAVEEVERRPAPFSEAEERALEAFDLLYRSLCAFLYNYVPTSGHPGGSISSGRLAAALVFGTLDYDLAHPHRPEADILSYAAGHKALGLYALWALRDEIARVGAPELLPHDEALRLRLEDLLGFRRNPVTRSPLFTRFRSKALDGHPTPATPFVRLATGASGVGVGSSLGLAWAARDLYGEAAPRVHIVEGEGGLTPGRVAEAVAAAATAGLDNAFLHLDWNQSSIDSDRVCRDGEQPGEYVPWDPREFFRFHDWNVVWVPDGSSLRQVWVAQRLALGLRNGRPTALVYRTRKGWRYGIEGRASHGAGHALCSEGFLAAVAELTGKKNATLPTCPPGERRCAGPDGRAVMEACFWEALTLVRRAVEEDKETTSLLADKLRAALGRLQARHQGQEAWGSGAAHGSWAVPDVTRQGNRPADTGLTRGYGSSGPATGATRQGNRPADTGEPVAPLAPDLDRLYRATEGDGPPPELVLAPGTVTTLRAELGRALGYLNRTSGGAVLAAAADLLGSTSINLAAEGFPGGFWHAIENPRSRILAAGGICEDAMSAILSGIAAFGSHLPVGASYGAFLAPLGHIAARLHAIGQQARRAVAPGEPYRPMVLVCAHAGLKTGEDGPTHADPQALQLLQGNFPAGTLVTLTPWEPAEVWPLLAAALRLRPAVIAPFVTRPPEKVPDRAALGLAPAAQAAQGVYRLRTARGRADGVVVLQESGAAYAFVEEALPLLEADGVELDVYYVASEELFDALPPGRREEIFPEEAAQRAMGITGFTLPTLYRWVKSARGRAHSLHAFQRGHYLGSGTAEQVLEEAGLDGRSQYRAVLEFLGG